MVWHVQQCGNKGGWMEMLNILNIKSQIQKIKFPKKISNEIF